jgi:hypothetical protein
VGLSCSNESSLPYVHGEADIRFPSRITPATPNTPLLNSLRGILKGADIGDDYRQVELAKMADVGLGAIQRMEGSAG